MTIATIATALALLVSATADAQQDYPNRPTTRILLSSAVSTSGFGCRNEHAEGILGNAYAGNGQIHQDCKGCGH